MTASSQQRGGYHAGHPWYYLLGGDILTPKQIVAHVKADGYLGYLASDIAKADRKSEPQRTVALRLFQEQMVTDCRSDMSRYRQLVRALRNYRKQQTPVERPTRCDDIHSNICLKYCHLYNDFAHLHRLEALLTRQPDLFGLEPL